MKKIILQNFISSLEKIEDTSKEKIVKKKSCNTLTSEIWVHAESIGEK